MASVIINQATLTSPGHRDNPERWASARITASHVNIMLRTMMRDDSEEVFTSAKYLMTNFHASCGVHLDDTHLASNFADLIAINNEVYKMAVAKS